MIYFARIQVDNFRACGVFSSSDEGADVLSRSAEVVVGADADPEHVLVEYKPDHKMTEQDIADAGAMVVGAVVVLTAH